MYDKYFKDFCNLLRLCRQTGCMLRATLLSSLKYQQIMGAAHKLNKMHKMHKILDIFFCE